MDHAHVGKMIKSLKIKKLTHHFRVVCTSLRSLFVYSLVGMSCVVICTSPLWIPYLCLSFKSFFFTSLPNFVSVFLAPKSLFLLGNLIVLFLVGESKILNSGPAKSAQLATPPQPPKSLPLGKHAIHGMSYEVEKMRNIECEGVEEEDEYWTEWDGEESAVVSLVDEDLRKRADDFIAKVNKQIRIEYHGDVCCC